MERINPPPPRASRHRRKRRTPDSALGLRALPSPEPAAKRESMPIRPVPPQAAPSSRLPLGAAPRGTGVPGVDWERIEELASKGLTLEQIAVEMDWPGLPPPLLRVRVDAAIKRGRAKGSAELKRKHYDAAMKGSVSAQKVMLALLESEEEDDEPVEVEEVILDADGGEGAEDAPQD